MFLLAIDQEEQIEVDLIDKQPLLCFFGRSNVGKSSLLNGLFKSFARISKTPGKTRTLNLYKIEDTYLLDVPGYGYSVRSKKEKHHWHNLITTTLKLCSDLVIIIIQDANHPNQESDEMFLDFIKNYSHQKILVFNKIDKLRTQKDRFQFKESLKVLSKKYKDIPYVFPVSAQDKKTLVALKNFLQTGSFNLDSL